MFPGCRINPLESKLLIGVCNSENRAEEVHHSMDEIKHNLKNESDVEKHWQSIGFSKAYGRYTEAKEVIRYIVQSKIKLDIQHIWVSYQARVQAVIHSIELALPRLATHI